MLLMIIIGLLSIGKLNKQFFPDFDVDHPDAVIRVDEAREPDRDFWMKEPEPQETAAVVVSAARAFTSDACARLERACATYGAFATGSF